MIWPKDQNLIWPNEFSSEPEHSCQNTSSHRMFRMSHSSDDTRSRLLWKRLRLTYLWIFWHRSHPPTWPHHFSVRLNPDLPYSISGTLVTLSKKPAGIVIYVCGHTLKWRGKIKTDLRIEAMCQNCWVWCIFVVGRGRRENCWESVETMHEGGELLSHLLLSCNTGCERNWQCDCSNSTTETETCVCPIVCGEKGAWINWNKNFFTFLYKYTKSV